MTKIWNWSKPVSWADICRANMMLNDLTSGQIRKRLEERIDAGDIIQLKRGLYYLAKEPAQTVNKPGSIFAMSHHQ